MTGLNQRKVERRRQSGQAITEYASILAFIAGVVMMVFSFGPGKLSTSISNAFASISQQIDSLSHPG